MFGHDEAFRHRTRIVVPPSLVLTVLAAAAVTTALVVGWFVAAALVVATYVGLGGTVAGRAASWHVYAVATSLLLGCTMVAFLALRGAQGEWYAVAFLAAAVFAGVACARAATRR